MIEANTMNMLIADMDELLDYFYKSNYKTLVNPDMALKKKPTQTDAKVAIEYYGVILDMIQNPDPDDLRKLSKPQQTKYIKQIEKIIECLSVFVKRKPRAKKKPSVDRIVSKLKFLPNEGVYESIEPGLILESNILWTYNTKTRKLTKYEAPKDKKLSVKGTSVIDFDPELSYTKILRKPDDILPQIVTLAKKSLDITIRDLKTKATVPNGRINTTTLLLRAFK